MSRRLEGRTALVTGGSRGIGRAIAQALAREGAAVAVNFVQNSGKADEVVAGIREAGGRALAVGADVASRDQVAAMMNRVTRELGPVDILVNNAGVLLPGTVLELKEDELDRMLTVNVKGIIYCTQAAAPGMVERKYGKIVNLSSLAGLGTAVAGTTPYAVTKAAVISLTKRLALELGPHRINVNAIAPGFIRTEMLNFLDTDEDRARLDALGKKAMLGRVGVPEDIAGVTVFLASDESSFMTAQVLTVDGGRTDFLTHSA